MGGTPDATLVKAPINESLLYKKPPANCPAKRLLVSLPGKTG